MSATDPSAVDSGGSHVGQSTPASSDAAGPAAGGVSPPATTQTNKQRPSGLKRILQVLAPERLSLLAAAVAMVVASAGNFAIPTLLAALIDRSSSIGAGDQSKQQQQQQRQQQRQQPHQGQRLQLWFSGLTGAQVVAVCGGVVVTSGLASFVRTYILGCVTARTSRRLRKQVFDVLVDRELDFFDSDEVRGVVV
jgi:ABC-type multidrug transport system fused ATPase/permease subunit